MDPIAIAAAVVTVLTPYIKDVGKELVKTVGEVGSEKAKSLLGWLKDKFSGDPSAAKDLSRFESDPEKFESVLKSTIEEKTKTDPAFAAELQNKVDDIGSDIQIFQRFKEGKNIIGVDSDLLPTGKTAIHQEGEKVEGMTGLRAKK